MYVGAGAVLEYVPECTTSLSGFFNAAGALIVGLIAGLIAGRAI